MEELGAFSNPRLGSFAADHIFVLEPKNAGSCFKENEVGVRRARHREGPEMTNHKHAYVQLRDVF